jgi:uroporphyrinogen-III synthase
MPDPSESGVDAEGEEPRGCIAVAPRRRLQALVTRPHKEAQRLAEALAARGVGAILEPMMQVHYFTTTELDLTSVQAVLCTSANGVRALAQATSERALPLLAVGEATAGRARAEGFITVASADGTVTDLAHLAAARLRPQDGSLLHVAGNNIAGDLVGALRVHGFAVERRVLYEARPVEALSAPTLRALHCGRLNFALFFSPRTASIFVNLTRTAGVAECCRMTTALSISAATDAVLADLSWSDRRAADKPNQSSLLDTLDSVLSERR